jgi:alkyl hydroperoxide reductase subunit AhpF
MTNSISTRLAVLGSGPAGYTAAIYAAARALFRGGDLPRIGGELLNGAPHDALSWMRR